MKLEMETIEHPPIVRAHIVFDLDSESEEDEDEEAPEADEEVPQQEQPRITVCPLTRARKAALNAMVEKRQSNSPFGFEERADQLLSDVKNLKEIGLTAVTTIHSLATELKCDGHEVLERVSKALASLKQLRQDVKILTTKKEDLEERNNELQKKNERLVSELDLQMENFETHTSQRLFLQESINKIEEVTSRRAIIDKLKVQLYDQLVENRQMNTALPQLAKVYVNHGDIETLLKQLTILTKEVQNLVALTPALVPQETSKKRKYL